MGQKTYTRPDGSTVIAHVANIGVNGALLGFTGYVLHDHCGGVIGRRLGAERRPFGKPYCLSCGNTLGRKVIPHLRTRYGKLGGVGVNWKLTKAGMRNGADVLQEDHELLCVGPGANLADADAVSVNPCAVVVKPRVEGRKRLTWKQEKRIELQRRYQDWQKRVKKKARQQLELRP